MISNNINGLNVIINNSIGYKNIQKISSKFKWLNKILLRLFGTYKYNTGETYIFDKSIIMNQDTYNILLKEIGGKNNEN